MSASLCLINVHVHISLKTRLENILDEIENEISMRLNEYQ